MAEPEKDHAYHGWHLRKEVNLTHILTTLMIVAAILKFGYSMDTRITVLETQYHSQQENNYKMEKWLSRISDKLDRLIERQ